MRRSRVAHGDAFRRSPKSFERIKGPGFRTEDVDDEVEVIEQDPTSVIAAFDVCGLYAFAAERFLNGIGDRLNLARVLPGRWPAVLVPEISLMRVCVEESQHRRYWRRHVETMPADVASDARRHHAVDRFAGADAATDIGGGHIWCLGLHRQDGRPRRIRD